MMKAEARSDSLDAFRLIAILFVVALHIELNHDLPEEVAVLIRLGSRWAVPFFFILTGYFLGPDEPAILRKSATQSARLLWIFCFASLLYVPAVILAVGVRTGLLQILQPATFAYGTQYHLWFLSSMFVGLQIIHAAYRFGLQKYLPFLAAMIVLLALATGSYGALYGWNGLNSPQFDFARHLLSVPFMWIGLAVARGKHFMTVKAAALLALTGLLVEIVEVHILQARWGSNPLAHEFLLGTLPFTLGIFGIGRALEWHHCRFIASWGRRFSLGIYIVHFWWSTLLTRGLVHPLATRGIAVPSLFFVGLIFGFSLASMLVLERCFPSLKRLLDGRLGGDSPLTGGG
jgi:surface polysaccharide O-acyltransferase-like enzyme